MPFTEKERQQYLAEKKKREVAHHHDTAQHRPKADYACAHCQNGFGINEGVVTDDVAICDTCLGG